MSTPPSSIEEAAKRVKAPPDVRWFRQEDAHGCAVACLAMVTGESYADVAGAFVDRDLATQGLYRDDVERYLGDRGWWARGMFVGEHRAVWPPEPFAAIHICNVDQPSSHRHSVLMLSDGTVLDPLREGTYRLTDWPKVNNVIGFAALDPQLAEWVEKALPAMQAMVEEYGVEFFGNKWRTDPTHPVACGAPDEDSVDRAWVALRDIVEPSSFAAEDKPTSAEPGSPLR